MKKIDEQKESEDRQITMVDHVRILGDYDLLAAGQELAEIEERLSVAKADLKKITADHKSRITEIETDRTMLSRVIRTKQEDLVTECYADPDYSAGTMVFTSVETGLIILERGLTNEERQMKLIDIENSGDAGVNPEGLEEEAL